MTAPALAPFYLLAIAGWSRPSARRKLLLFFSFVWVLCPEFVVPATCGWADCRFGCLYIDLPWGPIPFPRWNSRRLSQHQYEDRLSTWASSVLHVRRCGVLRRTREDGGSGCSAPCFVSLLSLCCRIWTGFSYSQTMTRGLWREENIWRTRTWNPESG